MVDYPVFCKKGLNMRLFKFSALVVITTSLLITLSGCANSGNQAVAKLEDENSVEKILIVGQTTKDEVLSKFGQPDEMDYSESGNLKWTYRHVRSTWKASSFIPVVSLFKAGKKKKKKHLVIVFDKDNKVAKRLFTKSKGETVAGFLG